MEDMALGKTAMDLDRVFTFTQGRCGKIRAEQQGCLREMEALSGKMGSRAGETKELRERMEEVGMRYARSSAALQVCSIIGSIYLSFFFFISSMISFPATKIPFLPPMIPLGMNFFPWY